MKPQRNLLILVNISVLRYKVSILKYYLIKWEYIVQMGGTHGGRSYMSYNQK